MRLRRQGQGRAGAAASEGWAQLRRQRRRRRLADARPALGDDARRGRGRRRRIGGGGVAPRSSLSSASGSPAAGAGPAAPRPALGANAGANAGRGRGRGCGCGAGRGAADGGDLVRGAAPAPPPRARCLLSLRRAGEALRPSLPLSRRRDCSAAATARRAPAVAAALRPGDRPLFGRRRRQPGAALAGSCHLLHRPRCRCRRVAAASSASRRPRCCPRSLRLGQRGLILVSENQMKAKL